MQCYIASICLHYEIISLYFVEALNFVKFYYELKNIFWILFNCFYKIFMWHYDEENVMEKGYVFLDDILIWIKFKFQVLPENCTLYKHVSRFDYSTWMTLTHVLGRLWLSNAL